VLCIAVARVGAGEIFDGLSIVAHRGDNLIQSRGEMNLGAELDLAMGRAIDGLGTSRLLIEWSLVRIQPGEPRKDNAGPRPRAARVTMAVRVRAWAAGLPSCMRSRLAIALRCWLPLTSGQARRTLTDRSGPLTQQTHSS
jgi:hypothetical protein